MRYGFTYRGIHSSAYNIIFLSGDRTTRPEVKIYEIEIPGRHGTQVYGGRTYNKRSITGTLQFVAGTLEAVRARVREIAEWLSKPGRLSFDDEPGKYYDADVIAGLDLAQALGYYGTVQVTFSCQPFALSEVRTVTGETAVIADVQGTQPTPCIITIRNMGDGPITNITISREGKKT